MRAQAKARQRPPTTAAKAAGPGGQPTTGKAEPLRFDPHDIDLEAGVQKFRFAPLETGQRALHMLADGGVNGHPVDWMLTADPCLDEALVAVRRSAEPQGPPKWFHRTRTLREETFHSPFSGLDWRPDTRLVRRLLYQTPYVVVVPVDGEPHYAFDVRTVEEPKRLAETVRTAKGKVLPASGVPWTEHGRMAAIVCQVPFSGDRFARSTRKRFALAVPGGQGDATVEGAAAQILRAHGYHVETPRLVVALYRMLVGEAVHHWWRAPLKVEGRGAATLQPPGLNPLEALARGLEAVHRAGLGEGPDQVRALGKTIVASGRRPKSYLRYTDRLARFAETLGAAALAGNLEGILRGHRPTRADLVAGHPGTGQSFLVEVKSTGDRLRETQMAAALWHERDGRCGYRLMKMEHPKE